jgi:hypothetical protein
VCGCTYVYIYIYIYVHAWHRGAHEPHISTPVHQAPLCLPAGPEGAGQLVTFAPRAAAASTRLDHAEPRPPARRLPPRQLGRPTGHRPPPRRAHLRASPCLPPLLRPFPPMSFPRHPRARRLTPLACLPACLPACLSGRARLRRPFSYTYPPTSTGPPSCVQTFRGPKVVPGEAHLRGQTARLPPGHVPRPTGDRPSSPGGGARAPEEWTTGRARTTISARQLVCTHGGGDPREPVVAGPPASPEKGVWPPSKRPALPDPLMGGVCQQI